MDKIRVVLPEKYNLVVGDTFQLFYRGIIEAPDPFCYDVLAVCDEGRNFPRYFEFLPDKAGTHKLKISVFAADKTLLGSGETVLNITESKEPEEPINILCIGDSITAEGQWPEEAFRRLTDTEGNPKGLGYKNISFVGGCGRGNVHFEGYGGWNWESYLSSTIDDIWVTCKHKKTTEDQHSIWKDDKGNLWKLETIDVGRLKFVAYGSNSGEKTESGRLVHVKNATETEDILFTESYYERPSPFYDEESKSIDFKAYCRKIEVEKIDGVYIMLGYNGRYDVNISDREFCKHIVSRGKELVDIIHRDFPDAKVKIMGIHVPSVNGGVGTSYGATLPYCDDYGLTRYVMELNIAYREWAKEVMYEDYVEFINISGQFDSDYNFPFISKPVNTRSSHKEIIGINGLHPCDEGYMQIADAVFRSIVATFCE